MGNGVPDFVDDFRWIGVAEEFPCPAIASKTPEHTPEEEKMNLFDCPGYRSEKTRWIEDLFSHSNENSQLDYNFFEGLHCGMICLNGYMYYPFDEKSPPHKATIVLFEDNGLAIDDDVMRMYQSALLDSASGINSFATAGGFHFSPYWFNDVMNVSNIKKFSGDSLPTFENLDDILEKSSPEIFTKDNELVYSVNVKNWIFGFFFGFHGSDILKKLSYDKNLQTYLLMLASLRDNCYHVQLKDRTQPLGNTLKLADFFMFAFCVPAIVSEIYSAIQLEGRYEPRQSSKRRNILLLKKRKIKERLHRRRNRLSSEGACH
jgi:hypothetical protein